MEVTRNGIDYTVHMCTIQGNNVVLRRQAKKQAKGYAPSSRCSLLRRLPRPARGPARQRSSRRTGQCAIAGCPRLALGALKLLPDHCAPGGMHDPVLGLQPHKQLGLRSLRAGLGIFFRPPPHRAVPVLVLRLAPSPAARGASAGTRVPAVGAGAYHHQVWPIPQRPIAPIAIPCDSQHACVLPRLGSSAAALLPMAPLLTLAVVLLAGDPVGPRPRSLLLHSQSFC
jgi:hypothetical protein